MSPQRASSPALAVVILALLCAPAAAQDEERIVDPLDPTAAPADEGPGDDDDWLDDDDKEDERSDEDDDGDEELIADPLDPTDAPQKSNDDEEILVDPLDQGAGAIEPTTPAPAPPVSQPPVAHRAGFFKGRYATRLASDLAYDNPHEDVFEWRNQLTLGVRFEPGEALTVLIEGRLTHWLTTERGDEAQDEGFYADTGGAFDAELREALLRWSPGDLTLTVGNQFVLWGAMDLVSPAQLVHPSDLRQGLGGDGTDGLVPVFGVDLRWYAAAWLTLEALVVPFYTAPRGQFVGHDLSLLSPGSALAAELAIADALDVLVDDGTGEALEVGATKAGTPDELPQNASAGARLTASLGGFDLGLGYFFGWDPTPVVTLDPDLAIVVNAVLSNPEVLRDFDVRPLLTDPRVGAALLRLQARSGDDEALFEADYRRNHSLELDAVTYFGPVGLRSELVFAPSRTVVVVRGEGEGLFGDDGSASLQTRRVPVLDAALGLSWESSDTRWVIVTEGFYRATFGLADDERPLAGARHLGGSAVAVRATPLDDWRITAATLWNASAPHDLVISLSTGYVVLPGLELTAEAIVFEGAELSEDVTVGGLFDHADELALGLAWVF